MIYFGFYYFYYNENLNLVNNGWINDKSFFTFIVIYKNIQVQLILFCDTIIELVIFSCNK